MRSRFRDRMRRRRRERGSRPARTSRRATAGPKRLRIADPIEVARNDATNIPMSTPAPAATVGRATEAAIAVARRLRCATAPMVEVMKLVVPALIANLVKGVRIVAAHAGTVPCEADLLLGATRSVDPAALAR
jgi:hypothetical protein